MSTVARRTRRGSPRWPTTRSGTSPQTRPNTRPFRLGPAIAVPRHPINLYYDVGTREEQVNQYNYRYFEACEGESCLKRPINWAQYLDVQTFQILQFVSNNGPNDLRAPVEPR